MSVLKRWIPAMMLTATMALGGCQFSPWETDTVCRDRYHDNLERLKAQEASAPEPYTVALLADVHTHLDDLDRVVDRINARTDVEFVLVLGDITDNGLALQFEWACKGISRLRAPTFYVLGNHDSIAFGPSIFTDTIGPIEYAFGYAGTRYVVYNDNAYEFADVPPYEWMAQAAAVALGEVRHHTVGVSHIPPIVDVHDAAEIDRLLLYLDQQGFDYTVHGHRHVFGESTDAYGNRHVVVSRVKGVNHALMRVSSTGISFTDCSPDCP